MMSGWNDQAADHLHLGAYTLSKSELVGGAVGDTGEREDEPPLGLDR